MALHPQGANPFAGLLSENVSQQGLTPPPAQGLPINAVPQGAQPLPPLANVQLLNLLRAVQLRQAQAPQGLPSQALARGAAPQTPVVAQQGPLQRTQAPAAVQQRPIQPQVAPGSAPSQISLGALAGGFPRR